jgi:hypothetical protein
LPRIHALDVDQGCCCHDWFWRFRKTLLTFAVFHGIVFLEPSSDLREILHVAGSVNEFDLMSLFAGIHALENGGRLCADALLSAADGNLEGTFWDADTDAWPPPSGHIEL